MVAAGLVPRRSVDAVVTFHSMRGPVKSGRADRCISAGMFAGSVALEGPPAPSRGYCQPSPISTPGGGTLSSGTKKSGASGMLGSIR
jgi:hypothetical protein